MSNKSISTLVFQIKSMHSQEMNYFSQYRFKAKMIGVHCHH